MVQIVREFMIRGYFERPYATLLRMEKRGEDLKELGQRRKLLGFSQEKFALHTGIDRSYMGCIERGERNVSFWLLCDVAEALNCDLGALTAGLPKRKPSKGPGNRPHAPSIDR